MNRENVATLIQDIRESKTFNMTYEAENRCGTPGCFVGHVAHRLMGIERFAWLISRRFEYELAGSAALFSGMHQYARMYLGLTLIESSLIFTPEPNVTGYNWRTSSGCRHITQEHAVCMLEAIYNDAPIDENIWFDTDPETSRGQRANAERMEFQLVPA